MLRFSSVFSRCQPVVGLAHRGAGPVRCVRFSSQAVDLKKTELHELHLSRGGRMVEFAGWSMPVQYSNLSIINSTLHTRQSASLFDVSHMLQLEVRGGDAEQFLESVMVADLKDLAINTGTLSVFTTETGGIIDDCIVTRTSDQSFYIVANAGCAEKDIAHLKAILQQFKGGSSSVSLTPLEDKSLIAYQGPEVVSLLEEIGLSSLPFMSSATVDVCGVSSCRVTRCGYTGEDGVEISVPSSQAVELAERLESREGVEWAGLGARDILRLEAGLCLYGNDLSEDITPIEAGLAWCISDRRRSDGGFRGDEAILAQLKSKPPRRRVGLMSSAGPPPRNAAEVLNKAGEVVGKVTSGCPSPCLKQNIAMAYVPRALSKTGRVLQLRVRSKTVEAEIVKMPFVSHKYYTGS